MSAHIVERFRDCFEHRTFTDLAGLYAHDASLHLLVGDFEERRTGPAAIVARYVEDHDPPATFLGWDIRLAPWGAVVEVDALQTQGPQRLRFRWVHVLVIEHDRIVHDRVYCTGGVPCPGAGDDDRGGSS